MLNLIVFVFNQLALILATVVIGFIVATFLYVVLKSCIDIWRSY